MNTKFAPGLLDFPLPSDKAGARLNYAKILSRTRKKLEVRVENV